MFERDFFFLICQYASAFVHVARTVPGQGELKYLIHVCYCRHCGQSRKPIARTAHLQI